MDNVEINTPLAYVLSVSKFTSTEEHQIAIIASATGVKKEYYTKFAQFLADSGVTTYTFDYGGINHSKKTSLRSFDTSLTNWATNDIESVLLFVKQQHPNAKIHYIGHSIGGQLLGLVPSNHLLSNVVLVASQSGHTRFWSGFSKVKMLFNWYVVFPLFCISFGYLPSKKIAGMEDLPKSMALEFARWGRQRDYLFHYKDEHELFFDQLKGTLTVYSCPNDEFAPKGAIDWLAQKYTQMKLTRKHLNPKEYGEVEIGHFGFFKSRYQHSIWKEFLADLSK